jgi:hypothetical protein
LLAERIASAIRNDQKGSERETGIGESLLPVGYLGSLPRKPRLEVSGAFHPVMSEEEALFQMLIPGDLLL